MLAYTQIAVDKIYVFLESLYVLVQVTFMTQATKDKVTRGYLSLSLLERQCE